jgi:large repetitive protein
LPASADWVHEWQSFWVEIWVSTPDTTTVGITEAVVDLHYFADYLTAQEIQYGPAFTKDLTGEIQDNLGRVHQIGGGTLVSGLGQEGYVLLARVRFASTGDDQVPVDQAGWNIGPYDMQMALASGLARLADGDASLAVLGDSPDTELWAVVYDIDDNNQIDFGDFSFFAAAFGRTVGDNAEPPYVWWADFDKSGRVDFGDLAFFAPNFNKSRTAVQSGNQTLIFPPGFPDTWLAGSGGG